MISRRTFLVTSSACAAGPFVGALQPLLGDNLPPALVNAKAQFYNFLKTVASGLAPQQNIVLNSTILPFDIAADTPFYNEELFREYADRTFTGGVEGLQADGAAFLAARFSSQYRSLINIINDKIDQNHPEIANSVADLLSQQTKATNDLNSKISQLDASWNTIAAQRGLVDAQGNILNQTAYDLQFDAWAAQVRYGDQLQTYTDALDNINGHLDAVRRSVYTPSEIAALDNFANLSSAYNVARPWHAQLERSLKNPPPPTPPNPLTDLYLANPRGLPPTLFDIAPLVFPVGDLVAFLSAPGVRGYDSSSQSYQLDSSSKSWTASGGGSFLGWSLGGGASGSTSMTTSVSTMNSLSISFKNLSEYLADRSAWFNPAVLQDPNILRLIQGRPELNHLRYVAVSLLIARGTTLILKFSHSVTSSDWSQSAFSASGGVSFLGFSFGASGGSSSSSYSVSTSADGTTVTIQDGDTVARVLGARVEAFIQTPPQGPLPLNDVISQDQVLRGDLESLRRGKLSYLEFQKKRNAAAAHMQK